VMAVSAEERRSYHGYYGPVQDDCSNFNGHVGCTDGK